MTNPYPNKSAHYIQCFLLLLLVACTSTTTPVPVTPSATPQKPTLTPKSLTRTPPPSPPMPTLPPTNTPDPKEIPEWQAISEITFDSQDNVWIVGWENALKLNPADASFTSHPIQKVTISHEKITSAMMHHDILWIGTFDGKVLFLHDDGQVLTQEFAERSITSFGTNTNNQVCLTVSLGGVSCYNGETWEWYGLGTVDRPMLYIHDFTFQPDGTLWVIFGMNDSSGVTYWNGETWDYETPLESLFEYPDHVETIVYSPRGTLWARATNAICYSETKDVWTKYSFSEFLGDWEYISSFAMTSEDIVWIGTSTGQIAFLDKDNWHILDLNLGNHVTTVRTAPDDTIWIGTQNGQLVHILDEEKQCYQVTDLQITQQPSCEQ